MTIRKRAMSEAQKLERRQAFLEAAQKLFQETSFNAINMDEVANLASVAKGTLYLYFKTKEELFLALYMQTIERWFDEIDEKLRGVATDQKPYSVTEFVALVGETLPNYPTLTRLMAISYSILERNIDEDTAFKFKQMLRARMVQTGQWTEMCLPFLRQGQGAHLLMQLYALTIGFQSLSEPAPIVKRMLMKPELNIFQVQFDVEFLAALTALLNGIETQNRRKND